MFAAVAMTASLLPATAASAQQPAIDPDDPRVGLAPGYLVGGDDAPGEASLGMEHLANIPKPGAFSDGDSAPLGTAGIGQANSDLAFSGDYAFMGNYAGWTAYDISDPADPSLAAEVVCPGGQGDVSIYGDLLFVSVEQATSKVDCSTDPEAERFQGVRIFDVSSVLDGSGGDDVEQVAAVQACRGSHTHTVVEDLDDADTVYIYVQGTTGVRPADTLEGCANPPADDPDFNEDSSRFRIEIIEVPLDAPEDAAIIEEPRLFATGEGDDYRIDGLWPGGSHGAGWQSTAQTDACHDITAYPEIGLAAGACEGNGLLIDITDPRDPQRVDAVIDRNFAYWHSATFSNDGTKVVFTDEWGGGTGARCQATDRPEWGANAIFDIVEGDDGPELEFAEYYKLPAPQTANENCVAHNGSLVPIPGRDVMVQAWYQGGISLWDFTDSASPYEIGYFDRGPTSTEGGVNLGGHWSAYWYDGYVYGSAIVRGFDTFALTPTDDLSQIELDVANDVTYGGEFNPQAQVRYEAELPDSESPVEICGAVDPVTFTDVAGGPHGGNIGCVAGFGIALGTGDGSTFSPARDVRRDQMASFLARLLLVAGVDLPDDAGNAFGDVTSGPHLNAVNQLADLGIVQGRSGDRYDPSASVTRAQMASFLIRSVELIQDEDLDAPRSPFTDIAGSVHAENIDVAYDLGIAEGRSATEYAPSRNVRRDQMGSFLARTLGHLDGEGIALTPLS
ncbi:hypothetical protein FTX61_06760 [Nitriliruptoraceae bacterium ZYF776]|nr:hypothetical protein [Profundirhabdus halotolerans]